MISLWWKRSTIPSRQVTQVTRCRPLVVGLSSRWDGGARYEPRVCGFGVFLFGQLDQDRIASEEADSRGFVQWRVHSVAGQVERKPWPIARRTERQAEEIKKLGLPAASAGASSKEEACCGSTCRGQDSWKTAQVLPSADAARAGAAVLRACAVSSTGAAVLRACAIGSWCDVGEP